MKSSILGVLFICLVFFGYIQYDKTNNISIIYSTEKNITVIDITPLGNKIKENKAKLKTIMVKKEIKIKSLFIEKDLDEALLSGKVQEGIDPIGAIGMEKGYISSARIGDILWLPTIDGNTYPVKITARERSNSGNVSIYGDFYDAGVKYSSIFTEGKEFALVTMVTPEGNYEVEIFNGIGFVYSTTDIEDARIDFSKSDTI